MGTRILLTLIWLGFIAYSFTLAPPQQPDTNDLILRLSTGDWQGINPAVVALFNAMGIWPMIYACLALADGHYQKLAAWPFVVGSFGLGAFLLLPYLILRRPQPVAALGVPSPLLESRWTGGLLLLGAVLVMGYGLWAGDWADFWEQWRSSRFIHVMGLDFCLLWGLLPTLLRDDMARRNWQSPWTFWLTTLVPLVGGAGYLLLRPGTSPGTPTTPAAAITSTSGD